MATTKQTKTEQNERRFPSQVLTLWKNKSEKVSEKGITYFTYFTGLTNQNSKLIGFYAGKKKNPKQPDLTIYYKNDDGSKGDEYANFWVNESKSGKKYLTGTIKETKEKLTAFINEKPKNEKEPYLRVYWKAELDKYNAEKKSKKETESKEAAPVDDVEDDLPF